MTRGLLSAALAAATLLLAAGPAAASTPRVQLLSHALGGGYPNGPSHDGVMSQDRQLTTLAAFDSDASNIVKGDTNGTTDVFLVHRKGPFSLKAPPWRMGKTEDITRRGNGPSYLPDIDGEQNHGPRCVAFVSKASNLVPGDTNGVADAFVYYLRTHRIRRVSIGSFGQQANGATYEVKIDGHCDRVAFVSDATNLALTGTSKLEWRSAVTAQPPAGVKQVYVHVLDSRADNDGLSGLTFLASASAAGAPGDADSGQISLARSGGGCGRQKRCGNFSAEAVFFASNASNLVPNDGNGVSDVFVRAFPRRFERLRFPHEIRLDGDRVRSTFVGVGPLELATKLVSAPSGGGQADGPSDSPSATDSGDFVAFRTAADNLFPGDRNGFPDVVRANTLSGTIDLVSRTASGGQVSGASGQPAIGRTGMDIMFQSTAGIDPNDRNCAGDIYHLDIPHDSQILTSLDSLNHIPNAPYGTTRPCPQTIAAPVEHPAVSYYLNYATWETSWPIMDAQLAARSFPGITYDRAAQMSNSDPALHQVYLRYVAPR